MKAVVLFPGIRYSCDTPLLYFAGTAFRDRGYQVFPLSYGDTLESADALEKAAALAGALVLEQLRAMPLQDCEDVVFVSKSIGTVLAGWTASQLDIPVRHIYLTPLAQTLPYINSVTDRVVGAGADPFLDAAVLTAAQEKQQFPLLMIPDVGHRLECKGNTAGSLHILAEIVELYHEFAR